MARRKVRMELIADRRVRAATFAKRKEGLRKKARELATLCGVPIALVCAGPDPGGGAWGGAMAMEVWESEEGVLARYRALPPDVRAQHAHRNYLEGELGKERAKLARVRQDGALEPWDSALNDITPGEARALLESIDAALRATSARRKALGLPDGDGDDGRLELQIPPEASNAIVPFGSNGVQYIGSSRSAGDDNQSWDDDTFQPHNADPAHPGYGFQCGCRAGGYVHMDGNANVHDGMADLSMWCAHGSTDAAPAEHHAFSTGADAIDAPGDFLTMGIGGHFVDASDYSTQCSASGFQPGDANLDQLHYLSDLADGVDYST